MPIIGVGTDIVNIKRIENILIKYGDKFLNKVFHPLEIEKYHTLPVHKKSCYLAKRFAAKEAFAKALGEGIGKTISFRDIATLNNEFGAPEILLSHRNMDKISSADIKISLSDDFPFALAFVVIAK